MQKLPQPNTMTIKGSTVNTQMKICFLKYGSKSSEAQGEMYTQKQESKSRKHLNAMKIQHLLEKNMTPVLQKKKLFLLKKEEILF